MSATVWPNMIYPQPTPQNIDWTPEPPAPSTLTRVNPTATQTAIQEYFDIQPPPLDGDVQSDS